MSGAFDWPPALEAVQRTFASAGNHALLSPMVGEAHHQLGTSSPAPPQPPLFELLHDWPAPTWVRLDEVAIGVPRALLAAKLVGGLTSLTATDQPGLLLNIGSNGSGDAGLAVGLPAGDKIRDRWCSALATEMIFNEGPPFGWSALNSAPYEYALIASSTTSGGGGDETTVNLPTVLEMLMSIGGSLAPWSADIVLRALPDTTADVLRTRVSELALKAARSVNRTDSRSEVETASYTDVQAELVLEVLEQWQTLAEDCLRVGGWTMSVRIRATNTADLGAMASSFRSAHGDLVHVSHPTRRQSWRVASTAETAAESATWVSAYEVADLMIFSGASVGRIQARRALASGRQTTTGTQPIDLGVWLGSSVPARIDVSDLSAHCFISGITGSGKSTTTRTLLAQLWNRHAVPFLVIDPAKTDYADFGRHLRSELRLVRGHELSMNVLRAWPGSDVAQHIARVGNVFRGSFTMPSPVPYVASILLDELAEEARHGEVTLHDAWARLDALIDELHYRGEIEDNIKASLGLRLRLLLQPSRADRVACLGAVPTWLTEGPTVVQLGDIADEEERNFLASMLVLYVSDAARVRGLSNQVQHVTVVEEAHRLMPEPRAVGPEDADAGAVSAKLMAQLLAEVRAYGEGLLIVDQSPAAVSREVLRNTNVKLVHRVVDRDDQQALGGALGLDEEDSSMLGSLAVGRLLVSSRLLVQPQTAEVDGQLPVYTHGERLLTVPPSSYLCHNSSRSAAHHLAERHGAEMEQRVALWTLQLGGDLRDQARRLVQQDRRLSASCLIQVGIRRYLRTLQRVGYLDDRAVPEFTDVLWAAAVSGSDPGPPSRIAAAPYAACTLCPEQCVARGVVSLRTLPSYRRAERRLMQVPDSDTGVQVIVDTMTTVSDAVGSGDLALAVGMCAGVHLAHASDLSTPLIAALRIPRPQP